MSVPVRLVMVKKTGKRYLYNGEHRDLVVCKGEVQRAQGCSLTHGPDKKFKRDMVSVLEVDLTEELAQQLYEESETKLPPPKVEVIDDEPKWVEWYTDFDGKRRAQLTKHADERLIAMGRDMAGDIEGIDEFAQDAAVDCAAYLPELTRAGVKEGYMVPCREAAADMIHEGIMRGLEEREP